MHCLNLLTTENTPMYTVISEDKNSLPEVSTIFKQTLVVNFDYGGTMRTPYFSPSTAEEYLRKNMNKIKSFKVVTFQGDY